MGEQTAIGWTDHTFNPWWGCTRVSPACNHCYAEAFAKRTGHDVWGKGGERRFLGDKHWAEPVKWNAKAEADGARRRVFCASMADVFEDRPDLTEPRQRLWDLIADTPALDWQLLTKRPENVTSMVPLAWLAIGERHGQPEWPDNVWVGATVEDQKRAEDRIPHLLQVPARVRFLSCEPLLGRVELARWMWLTGPSSAGPFYDALGRRRSGGGVGAQAFTSIPSGDIGWVIVGGESGPKHRHLDLDHARSVRDQCAQAGVPFFFKQIGGRTPTAGGDLLDGVRHKEFPRESMIPWNGQAAAADRGRDGGDRA